MMNPYYDERAIRLEQERRMQETEKAVARWQRGEFGPLERLSISIGAVLLGLRGWPSDHRLGRPDTALKNSEGG